MLVQAAALHSPGELVVAAVLDRSSLDEWSWLKWLPHLRPDRLGFEAGAIAVGEEAGNAVLADVRDLIRRRRAQARTQHAGGSPPPQLLLLIDERSGVDRAAVGSALAHAREHQVSVLWWGEDVRDLPGQTGAIVEVAVTPAVLSVTDVESGAQVEDASAEGLGHDLAEHAARQLAPLRDVGELARASDIPRQVGLLDLLDLRTPTGTALGAAWSRWDGGLHAPIGVGAEGPIELDLGNEGPHALVVGMTGSGKSELLRTFVAATAARVPPHRLTFLLFDYKGGAAFAPCLRLPHVVDVVRDLDEHLAERALVALNAEMKRREHVLAEYGARDLIEMTRRHPDLAPPLLVIAVDEFAKLRDEVPSFIDGVVDIAQRGRALGVHMVLAAQQVKNAFTPAIANNTGTRIALLVQTEAESEEVVASPLAARLPAGRSSRGRGFVRTGHGDGGLSEFQAAYVSGLTDSAQHAEMRVFDFGAAQHGRATANAPTSDDTDAESDLTLLGDAAREAQQELRLPVPSPPWLPVLPEVLSLADVRQEGYEGTDVAIGLVDLPQLQRQDPLVLELSRAGHAAVFGAGNSGRTTVLSSAALALAAANDPEQLTIYGLDAAGGGLGAIEALPHCGAVVRVDDEERVHRLLRMLTRRVEGRGSNGEAATTVLLVDDLASFAHQHDRPGPESPYAQLEQILAGGRAAGVHVILTASRRAALPGALAAHVGQRLALRMPTEDDMMALGLDAKAVRGARLTEGRGFTQASQEFQIAVPARDGKPIALAEAIESLQPHRGSRAQPIEVLPPQVARSSIGRSESLSAVRVGIGDGDLTVATIDLSEMHALIIGPYRSGRSTALAAVAHGVHGAPGHAPLHLLSPRRSPLRDLDLWETSAAGLAPCADAVSSLLERAERGEFASQPAVVVVDDGNELTDARTVTQLEQLVRLARDSELRVVASVETGSARGIGNSWIRELRREGHGLLLQPDLSSDGDILGARLPRSVPAALSPGRGFLVVRGISELVQIAS